MEDPAQLRLSSWLHLHEDEQIFCSSQSNVRTYPRLTYLVCLCDINMYISHGIYVFEKKSISNRNRVLLCDDRAGLEFVTTLIQLPPESSSRDALPCSMANRQ